jgi:hypothetical protein
MLSAMTQPPIFLVRLSLLLTLLQMLWAAVLWLAGARAPLDFHRSLTRLERNMALGLRAMLAAQGVVAPDLPDHALSAWAAAGRRAAQRDAAVRCASAKPQPRPAITSRRTPRLAPIFAINIKPRTMRCETARARSAVRAG